ncbi:hypothetical protein [Leucobacter japonicus]|uniref:hypothetical protein n=1 Tax=Leucobacter japonicus TaxID=1461259 RepID=UPI0006A75CFE|nr:hypothetical protein [Leucobacter japonicus]
MSQSDPSSGPAAQQPVEPAAPAATPASPADDEAAAVAAPADPTVHEPVVHEVQQEVTLQRSVRVTRLLVAGLVIGAVVAMIACFFFPIVEGAEYTLAQVAGFMALIGAAIGAGVGGIVALVLGLIVRRQQGTGVAIQHDVR